MLFNSFEFIFGFLPLALIGYWGLARNAGSRLWFLLAASLAFYSYWDWRFTPLLAASIVLNWAATRAFFAWRRRAILVAAIIGNLLCLGLFKYLGFFESIVADSTGWNPSLARLALPLGISFFTFHHIIYLADLLRGRAGAYGFRDYALYIALFPQILAGPLVRHSEIVPQFREDLATRVDAGWIARGGALFLIGLSKKLFLADPLASHTDPIYAKAAAGAITIGDGWTAALGFPLQIYFDFSAYSDMAIGLALLFGFVLPFNFAVPYRATSLRDFWRRWHMTLSRFLRDYLYIPLGGGHQAMPRHLAALLATMVLGGLWHGAGWTFILWGAAHGLGLVAGVLWRGRLPAIPTPIGWVLLTAFLIVTWVLFRAPSLHAAFNVYSAMLGNGPAGSMTATRTLLLGAAFALIGPASQDIVERLRPWSWLAPVAALATVLALLRLNDGPSYEFIYFRF